jgi:hypothetical protein
LATEYTLRRADGQPLGTFAQVQAVLCRLFPGIDFGWTTSGPEKVRLAAERGVELPEAIRRWMETLPSLLEGVVEGDDFRVEFGLGDREPVPCLFVEPRGLSPELDRLLTALEAEYGGELVVSGSDPVPPDQAPQSAAAAVPVFFDNSPGPGSDPLEEPANRHSDESDRPDGGPGQDHLSPRE